MPVARIAFVLLAAFSLAACSDKSPLKFYIDGVEDSLVPGKNYIEADLAGNISDACTTVQEKANVKVRLAAPGTVGPSLDATLTGYTVDYFYFDPNDGQLKGPVALLSFSQGNLGMRLAANSTGTVLVPIATYLVKAWSYGLTGPSCFGVPGFPGPGVVDRMIARVTVNGEDSTGKRLSAQGSILLFLYDYGPYPVTGSICAGMSTSAMIAALCP